MRRAGSCAVHRLGLTEERVQITEPALKKVISAYTREAGVRRLEQAIGRLTRKVALKVGEGEAGPFEIRVEEIEDLLGPEPFSPEQARREFPANPIITHPESEQRIAHASGLARYPNRHRPYVLPRRLGHFQN